jgi:hypothetical protein
MKSVKRTTENSVDLAATSPAVRFTDYDPAAPHSSELLGYYHTSSATRTGPKILFAQSYGHAKQVRTALVIPRATSYRESNKHRS